MAPVENLGDCAARLLQKSAGNAAFRIRRVRIGPRVECIGDGSSRLAKDGSGCRMVEIEAVVDGQNARIPADCQLNGRTYIGATAAVHPHLRPKLYANSRNSMPEVIFP